MVERVKINLPTEKQPGRFQKGVSGNPQGRPAGKRHQVSLLLEVLGQDVAVQLMHRVIHAALFDGDMRAIEMLLRRIWPERKGLVEFKLPALRGPSDLPIAMNALVQAIGAGELTPDEASSIAAVIETGRRTAETSVIMKRLEMLEAANGTAA